MQACASSVSLQSTPEVEAARHFHVYLWTKSGISNSKAPNMAPTEDKNTKKDIMDTSVSNTHTTPDDNVPRSAENEVELSMAERLVQEGRDCHTWKNYHSALELYTKALELCPNSAAYYELRSTTYMVMKDYFKAFSDAKQAVRYDASFTKCYLKMAKCCLAVADISSAIKVYQSMPDIGIGKLTVQKEIQKLQMVWTMYNESGHSYAKRDFRRVAECMDYCIENVPEPVKYKLMKAECLVFLEQYQESQDIVSGVLLERQFKAYTADAEHVQGLIYLYQQGNIRKAAPQFWKALQIIPSHARANQAFELVNRLAELIRQADVALTTGNLQQAYNLYTIALSNVQFLKVFSSTLCQKRANVQVQYGNIDLAIKDCDMAIKLAENNAGAYKLRAHCFLAKDMYEKAIQDYEKNYRLVQTEPNRILLDDAREQLQKGKYELYHLYAILGVPKTATIDEIKKAYKKLALVHHSDRNPFAAESERKHHEEKIREINVAHTVLADPAQKHQYDGEQREKEMKKGLQASEKYQECMKQEAIYSRQTVNSECDISTYLEYMIRSTSRFGAHGYTGPMPPKPKFLEDGTYPGGDFSFFSSVCEPSKPGFTQDGSCLERHSPKYLKQ